LSTRADRAHVVAAATRRGRDDPGLVIAEVRFFFILFEEVVGLAGRRAGVDVSEGVGEGASPGLESPVGGVSAVSEQGDEPRDSDETGGEGEGKLDGEVFKGGVVVRLGQRAFSCLRNSSAQRSVLGFLRQSSSRKSLPS
jgi:hypothetical protein